MKRVSLFTNSLLFPLQCNAIIHKCRYILLLFKFILSKCRVLQTVNTVTFICLFALLFISICLNSGQMASSSRMVIELVSWLLFVIVAIRVLVVVVIVVVVVVVVEMQLSFVRNGTGNAFRKYLTCLVLHLLVCV